MVCVRLRDTRKTQSNGGVDGRCDGAEDECQGSESGNKPLRLRVTLVSQPRALVEQIRGGRPCEVGMS